MNKERENVASSLFGDEKPAAAKPAKPKAEHFEVFWSKYPQKVAKGAARTAYEKAVANGASERDIYQGLVRCIEEVFEAPFIPHPSTWLNQERWLDEKMKAPPSRPRSNL
jgi:hypothetical protein